MANSGEYEIREASLLDKEAVLGIRENVYGGRDYLPAYFDDFIKSTDVTPFVLVHQGRIIGFNAACIVDGGETVVTRAGRISPDYEGKDLYGFLDSYVTQWVKSKGVRRKAFTASAMNQNLSKPSFRAKNKLIMAKSHLIYIVQAETLEISDKDIHPVLELQPITEELLNTYIRSDDVCTTLFPEGRISINSVPYQLMQRNVQLLMNDIHMSAFTDLRSDSDSCKGLLSFGTLFKAQRFAYQYTIDIYGSDGSSARLHLLRHMLELKQKVTGNVCVLLPFQKEFLSGYIDEVFLEFGYKRENTPSSENQNTWITCDFLFERDL